MQSNFSACVSILGNNISTDQIYPGQYLELVDPEEIAKHCLEGVSPHFVDKISNGGIVVAGTNFGCGSSREHAAITLKNAGVFVVIAESFARIFYRNAINLALPLVVCKGISEKVKEGDELSVNIETGEIKKLKTGECWQGDKMAGYALALLEAGGVKEVFRKRLVET